MTDTAQQPQTDSVQNQPNKSPEPPKKPDQEKDTRQQKIREPAIRLLETQEIIKRLESKFSGKVLCYYTPSGYNINQSHPDIFLEQLRRIGFQDQLTLVVVSNGGDSSASLRIASIIREYCRTLRIVVPSRCASAATVLALSADSILMCPSGYLTAIDTSLFHGLNPKDPNNEPVSISVDQIKRGSCPVRC